MFSNESLVADGKSTVSFRTFKRQLLDWSLIASFPSYQKFQAYMTVYAIFILDVDSI